MITRRAVAAAVLSLTAAVVLAGFSLWPKSKDAPKTAESPEAMEAAVAKPQSLSDMALGPADAKVTIV